MSTENLPNGGRLVQFFGIVEDRNDPNRDGRVRVRCYGIHTADKTQIPTSALPWAKVVMPTTAPRTATTNIWEGTMVTGFFADGADCQVPVVTGIMPTSEGGGSSQYGFTDPRENAPVGMPGSSGMAYNTGSSSPRLSAFADQSRYDSSLGAKKEAYKVDSKDNPYKEPDNPYNAQYPYNNVTSTESGHAIELDDSPGAERVHIFHRNGSFVEMHPDGTVVYKTVNDQHGITLANNYIMIGGNHQSDIAGNSRNFINGSYHIEVTGGDTTINVTGGNVNLSVNGNVNADVSGNINTQCGGDFNLRAGGNINMRGSKINLN